MVDEQVGALAVEQLYDGNNKVYIAGVSNRRIRNILQNRSDLFHVQFVTKNAFNVYLVDARESSSRDVSATVVNPHHDELREQLLHRIKSFQQASRDHNRLWVEFCDLAGLTCNPAHVDTAYLQLFFTRVRIQPGTVSNKAPPPIGGSQQRSRPRLSLA